ncbi:hypothetical protein BDN72DRAFT_795132 [Pluteus cervinus]|uniref:Uncharacterized protein n=1 Tax=Pluteus cervinus TaxID=181527 RepID=A0ACD3AXX5_9AGAR|nr:hypothetical protein BDN72DRAFT_795132 [Pluteus cervinus]
MSLVALAARSSSRTIASHSFRPGSTSTTNGAVVDRYNLIRRFFKQQHLHSKPSLTPLQTSRTGASSRLLLESRVSLALVQTAGHWLKRGLATSGSKIDEHGNNTLPKRSEQTPTEETSLEGEKIASSESPPSSSTTEHNYDDYPRLYQRLAQSLPHLHRPTREDLLDVSSGFWERLRIRFKWFTIRSFRRFNADDISAFVTWFFMGQTLWILIGTTTFCSVIFATANSLRMQHYIARAISDYLTSETGVNIVFESAIVPKWKDSTISFKNVYVSRRPNTEVYKPPKFQEHVAALGYDVSNHPYNHHVGEEEEEGVDNVSEEDWNMSFFDLNIDSVDVTLSLWRWLDGRGLVEDAVVKGVRGILDRRSVVWDPENPLDPAAFRHPSQPGDFELESFQLEDLLVTVYQANFRPYTASIFRADIKCFRKRWLFYDFLCAENVVGQFDNCLFSLHKPQSIGRTTEKDLKDGDWARMSRIRIDGVNIDHLQNSTTTEGPISWITSGKVDAVLDIKFPRDPQEDLPFNAILGEIADAISTQWGSNGRRDYDPSLERIPGQRELAKPPLTVPEGDKGRSRRSTLVSPVEPSQIGNTDEGLEDAEKKSAVKMDGPRIVIDIDLRFRDLKAAVPLFTPDLSYVNNALIRPIVAFINAHRTLVPINCRVVMDVNEFDGSWTMWESGLMDDISLKVYDALAYHVTHSNMARQRIRTVSLWSLQMTASAVLSALKSAMDPMAAQLKEAYSYGQYNLYDVMNVAGTEA